MERNIETGWSWSPSELFLQVTASKVNRVLKGPSPHVELFLKKIGGTDKGAVFAFSKIKGEASTLSC
jgi:hypothetical protein